jgi:O-methyltransferase
MSCILNKVLHQSFKKIVVKNAQHLNFKGIEMDKETIAAAYNVIHSQQPWVHEASKKFHHRVLPFQTLAPWLNDLDFMNTYEKIKNYTLVDIYRCYELWSLAKQSIKIDGAILEVGVWRGGSGVVLAEATKINKKKIYLADTFRGVVKAGENDTFYNGGEHSDTSLELVKRLISSFSLDNVQILEGIFPEDTQHRVQGNIAMLHCDVDVYSSTKEVVEWCLPRMSVGSTIVFDDYGFYWCEGVTKYCDELKLRNDFIFIHNLNGHAIFIKVS